MDQKEISVHAVRVLNALAGRPKEWLTNKQIADLVNGVAPRTVRLYTLRFAERGVVEQAEVFPGHRYRLAVGARESDYVGRLRSAAEALGEPLAL